MAQPAAYNHLIWPIEPKTCIGIEISCVPGTPVRHSVHIACCVCCKSMPGSVTIV